MSLFGCDNVLFCNLPWMGVESLIFQVSLTLVSFSSVYSLVKSDVEAAFKQVQMEASSLS